jgi:hypothetical protein
MQVPSKNSKLYRPPPTLIPVAPISLPSETISATGLATIGVESSANVSNLRIVDLMSLPSLLFVPGAELVAVRACAAQQ